MPEIVVKFDDDSHAPMAESVRDAMRRQVAAANAAPDPVVYGELKVTNWFGNGHHELHADKADPLVLFYPERLARENIRMSGDRIYAGLDLTQRPASRRPVWYQVLGWDAERKGLIIERVAS